MLTQFSVFHSSSFFLQPTPCFWTTMHAAFALKCLISTSERRQCIEILRGDIWYTWELSQLTEWSVYSESICILIVDEQWWRENVKALRDLGERIWLHLCPIKQLARSRGMPNIYLYLVASLHLSAYGFMTSKLFGEKKGVSRQSQWLITKADRDGRQTHTHTRIDVMTRLGDKEQRSRNLTHSLWQ